jgi:hypothetical protein
VELAALGFYFVAANEPLVGTFIPGQVELESGIRFWQRRDRDGSKLAEDRVEHLSMEAVPWFSVRQHHDGEIRIRQDAQTIVLPDHAARSCCPIMLPDHAARSCCPIMLPDHAAVVLPSCCPIMLPSCA